MSKKRSNIGINRMFPVLLLFACVFAILMFAPLIFSGQEKIGEQNNASATDSGVEWTGFLNYVAGGLPIGWVIGLGGVGVLAVLVSLDMLRRVGWI